MRGIAARGCEQDNGLDHGAAQRAFIGAAKKGREQLADGFVLFGLLDAVLLGENRGAVLVQQVDHAFGHKQQVAFHQPYRDRRADCRENAQAGCVGDSFLPAPLLLFGLELRIARACAVCLLRVMHGAGWIGADFVNGSDLAALGDDGIGGELAHLELRALCLVVGLWLIVADRGVLVAR